MPRTPTAVAPPAPAAPQPVADRVEPPPQSATTDRARAILGRFDLRLPTGFQIPR